MAVIGKIISGGQTGADRGALEAALRAGFAYGGLVPKGRLADGCVPAKFTAMVEADTEGYRFRTRWNAEHSDATLILAFSDQLEGGTQRTRQYCMNARKPAEFVILAFVTVTAALTVTALVPAPPFFPCAEYTKRER